MTWEGTDRRKRTEWTEMLIRIDENVKSMKENHCQHLEDCAGHRDKYEQKFSKIEEKRSDDMKFIDARFKPLENWQFKIAGALAALMIILQFIPNPWK